MANNNMNFAVDLLPSTTDTYNLGNTDKRWKIFANEIDGTIKANNIVPIESASFTTGKYGQDGSGTHYYEMLGSITPSSFEQMWLLHYIITIEVPSDTTYTYRADVEIYGVRNTYAAYKIFNSLYSKYPIYQHVILEGASSSYPHEFGYRLASSYGDTSLNKNVHIDIIETRNCTATFFDAPKAYSSSAPSNYTWRTFNATSNGMQETGDSDTITRLYASNNTMKTSTTMRLAGSSLFGFDRDNRAQTISLYNNEYTSTTTSINTARVYNSAGFDWTKGLFYNTGGNYAVNTDVYPGIDQSISAIDFRYTDNCVNSSALTTLGLERYKAVYFRGTIGTDGLFYLAPLTVSYNNQNYKRAWTQDIPTTADGYVYWFLGFPYYNSSYAGGYQLNFYLENKLFWYHNGKFQEYTGDAVTVNGHTVNKDVPSDAKFTDNNTTYTFENGTNGFKVTPSGGSAQTVTVTPSITNNVTGSGTSGYLAKFNGANTITNGPQLGTDATKFLNNKGEWATALTSHQDISGKVSKSGDTMTGNLIAPSIRIANTYYGITYGRTTGTPVETILHTGIKWASSSHMPVIHITGYAYGLYSPVEFKIGFYIYDNKIGWCGVTNMGAWQPDVFLFKDNHDNYDYVGVGLAGSCYYLQLQADLQDEMGKFGHVETDSSKWSWTFSTTTGVIPATDGGTICIQAPYRANILNSSKVNGHTVEANVPSNAKFTDTTALTSMTGTLAIDHGGTGATTPAGARTNLGLGSIATKAETDYVMYGGDDPNLGSGSPASTAKTYWADATKIPDNMIKAYYNHSGTEYSLIFSKRDTYGSILKWGYLDTYLRILRVKSGSWKSEDWEKISAGYADSAGSATNLATKPSLATSGTTQITVTAGGKTSDAYTVPYAATAPLSGISGADDLKAIEALSETSGLLKKTAANTWSLVTLADLGLSQALRFIGITSTSLSDGATTSTLAEKSSGSLIKTTGFVTGDVVIDTNSAYEYVWTGSAWERLGGDSSYKTTQTAKSDPTASTTTSTTFIDTISQDANGVITATKKTLPSYVPTSAGVTAVTWDSTNNKLTRTINGSAADVVTIGTIKTALALTKSDVGLGNVANSTYAGGTAVTLNNSSKASSTASFYAPTTGGTANTQALVGNGATTAPKWVDISPSITIGAGTGSAAPTVNVTVLGQSGTAKSITTASTSVYGVTKLNDGIASNSTSLAATANSALVAAQKVASSNTTSKLYLVGAKSQSTTGVDSYSYQYTYTNNGLLSALKLGLNLNGTEKAHLEWNNTDQSIDFIFD